MQTLTTVSVAGIMVLEKQLLQMEDDGQSSRKRARSSVTPASEVTTSWIELAKLVTKLMCAHYMSCNTAISITHASTHA